MSDEPPALPPPDPPPAPPPTRRQAPKQQRNLVPWIYGLGLVVLIFALIWIWQNPNPSPDALRPSQITDLVSQAENLTIRVEKLEAAEANSSPQALQKQVAALQAQVDKLPKPVPAPDLQPIEQQIDALRTQLANQPKAASGQSVDLAPLEQRVAALGQQMQGLPPPPDLGPIHGELDALTRQVGALSQLGAGLQAADQQRAALAQRLDALAQAEQDNGKQTDAAVAAVQSQVGQLHQQLEALQQQSSQVQSALRTAQRLARLDAARAALDAGEPLGPIDGAPQAVAAFADKRPPTEAALRLAFPQAAQAALAATGEQPAGTTFGQRVLNRAQSLITIREGNKVLVGDPAAGLLADAGQKLDAGDLSAAVADVSQLTGPPAQALAGWLEQARALLAARAALHDLMAHA